MPDRRRFALLKQPFALDALGDVTVTSPVTGDILQYNGTVWANTTVATMTGLSEAIDDRVAALLAIGNGLTATYNDPGNSYALSANIDGTSLTFAATVIQRAALTGDVTAAAGSNATTIANSAVTYAKIQNVSATARFLGRITAGAGVMEELTGTQATTLLDAFTSVLPGIVPASGGGTTNFLRADGTWNAPPGGGGGAGAGSLGSMRYVAGADVTGAAVTSVSISGLDLNADERYFIEIMVTGASGTPTLALTYNADTTAANYDTQVEEAASTASAAARANNAVLLTTVATSNTTINGWLTNNAGAKPHFHYLYASGDTTAVKSGKGVSTWRTASTNVTGITLTSSVASAIGIGSRIRVFKLVTTAAFDPNLRYDDFDDLDGTFGSLWSSAVSGGTSSVLTAVAGRPGIRRNDTGTGATGFALSTKANTTAAALPFIAYSDAYPVTVESEFRVPTLPDGTNTFIATVGLINTPTGTNSSAAVGIGWDAGASLARFMCRTRSSGGTVTTTYYATTAPAANTWYRGRVVVRATDVKAYIYLSGAWTLIATMTTNLPTEAGNPFFTVTKSAGTLARQIDVDYVWTYFDIVGGRPA